MKVQLYLIICCLYRAATVVSLNSMAVKFSKLESEFLSLKKEITVLKLSNMNLATNNQLLSHEIKVLQTKTTQSYCQLLTSTVCGPCTCFDDYNIQQKYYCDCQNLTPKRDCLAFYQAGIKINGIYMVTMNNLKTMQVYCDQTTDGGGWTVIQRRVDEAVNFYRNWTEYKEGFGYYHKNFYFGNKNIYVVTLQSMYPKGSQLRIDLEDWEGNSRYAKYNNFQVGNELTKYRMHVTGYTGNAGDSLASHNGKQFSTHDQDNDDNSGVSCANLFRGGWWYGPGCFYAHLNGEYLTYKQPSPGAGRGILWQHWKGDSLKHVEMKVRRNV